MVWVECFGEYVYGVGDDCVVEGWFFVVCYCFGCFVFFLSLFEVVID